MFDILSLWFRPRLRQGRRNPSTSRRNRVRPWLEPLEDRLAPAVFNVISTADNTSPVITAGHAGTAADPFLAPSLRSAISFVNSATNGANNVINLAVAGDYKITLAGAAGETDDAAGEFAIIPSGTNGSSLTIQNTSGGVAIVDGNHLNRVFDINPSNATTTPKFAVTMAGFTIQNGDAFDAANPDGPTSTGGGIRDENNVSLTLTNMVFTNNVANADGGGVVMENMANIGTWTLTINNCMFIDNHAGDTGGGFDTDGTGTVIVNNSVITGNTDVNQGAGVYIDTVAVGATFPGASMTMTGTVVSDNQAINTGVTASGGGISNAGNGTMTITNSTIAGNFSGGSGGGFSDENNVGTLVVSNSLFLDNSAVMSGGGIQEGGPSTTITNSVIQGNTSSATGGGLFLNGTAVSIAASTIVDNTAVTGGGGLEIQTTGAGAAGTTITNATITANSATGNAAGPTTANGGGIEAPATTFTGSLTLTNDTINGNFATIGGGLFWEGTTGSVALQNTIVAGNTANTGRNLFTNGTLTNNGGNVIVFDPLLGPLQNNGGPTVGAPGSAMTLETEALLPGSPALDSGVAAGAPATDERGFLRPDNGSGEKPDVGAFEFQDVTLAVGVSPTTPSVNVGDTAAFVITIANTSQNALPVDGSTLTVALSPGLTPTSALTFPVGALAPGHSTTFTVTAAAAAPGTQVIAATVNSPDTNPGAITTAAAISVTPPLPPFVSVAFSPFGEVLELVNSAGVLTQFDAFGAHTLFTGIRSASVAFPGGSEVLDVVTLAGALIQFDAAGAHVLLGGGVLSAGVGFSPFGEVLEVVALDGTLTQFDVAGAHTLGGGFRSASVAFVGGSEVLDVVTTTGVLVQFDAAGAHTLLTGIRAAGVAFFNGQEVIDLITLADVLFQFDAAGAHNFGPVG